MQMGAEHMKGPAHVCSVICQVLHVAMIVQLHPYLHHYWH